MKRLTDKVALITGAGSGIGRAMAERFAQDGAKILVFGRNRAALDETARLVTDAGGTALAHVGDVAREADIASAVDTAVTELGGVDILCNNAGILDMTPLANMDWSDWGAWDSVMATNVLGPAMFTKAVTGPMNARGGGVIVNTASVAGLNAAGAPPTYVVSKHALVGLTRATALEHGPRIRVNAIAPGTVRTGLTGEIEEQISAAAEANQVLKRLAEPAEIASVAAFLSSDDASMMTGAVVPIDGGWTAM